MPHANATKLFLGAFGEASTENHAYSGPRRSLCAAGDTYSEQIRPRLALRGVHPQAIERTRWAYDSRNHADEGAQHFLFQHQSRTCGDRKAPNRPLHAHRLTVLRGNRARCGQARRRSYGPGPQRAPWHTRIHQVPTGKHALRLPAVHAASARAYCALNARSRFTASVAAARFPAAANCGFRLPNTS